ncbi:hypothetical protein GGI35DRAFT_490026, partial [Trichoderma velutinum]
NEWVEGKRIQRVLEATHVEDKRLSTLFTALEPHLSSLEWVDALKALTTVHYIMQEGSAGDIVHYVARHLYVLSPCFSVSALPHGDIIQRYAKYLVQRTLLCNSMGSGQMRRFEFNSEAMAIDDDFMDDAEWIQQVLSVAVDCHMGICIVDKVLDTASRLLVLDIQMLFQALSNRLVYMLENFLRLPKLIMERTARLYSKFTGQSRAVERCINARMRRKNQPAIKLLPLKPLPELDSRFLKADLSAYSNDVDTELMWFNTEPGNQVEQQNQVVEKELPKTPVVDRFSEKHSLESDSGSEAGSELDLGSELLLIDFC